MRSNSPPNTLFAGGTISDPKIGWPAKLAVGPDGPGNCRNVYQERVGVLRLGNNGD